VLFSAPGIGGYAHDSSTSTYSVLNVVSQADVIHLAGGDHLGTELKIDAGPEMDSALYGLPLAFAGPIGALIGVGKFLATTVGPGHSVNTIVSYLSYTNAPLGAEHWPPISYIESHTTTPPAYIDNTLNFDLQLDKDITLQLRGSSETSEVKSIFSLTGADSKGDVVTIANDVSNKISYERDPHDDHKINIAADADGNTSLSASTDSYSIDASTSASGNMKFTLSYQGENISETYNINTGEFDMHHNSPVLSSSVHVNADGSYTAQLNQDGLIATQTVASDGTFDVTGQFVAPDRNSTWTMHLNADGSGTRTSTTIYDYGYTESFYTVINADGRAVTTATNSYGQTYPLNDSQIDRNVDCWYDSTFPVELTMSGAKVKAFGTSIHYGGRTIANSIGNLVVTVSPASTTDGGSAIAVTLDDVNIYNIQSVNGLSSISENGNSYTFKNGLLINYQGADGAVVRTSESGSLNLAMTDDYALGSNLANPNAADAFTVAQRDSNGNWHYKYITAPGVYNEVWSDENNVSYMKSVELNVVTTTQQNFATGELTKVVTDASGKILSEYTLHADGTTKNSTYNYAADNSYVVTSNDASGTSVSKYNSTGKLVEMVVTLADGSKVTTYIYDPSSGTIIQTVEVDPTADAGPPATLAVGHTLVNNTGKTAVNYTVAGLDTDATAVVTVSDGTHTSTHTYAANDAYAFDLSGFTDGPITSSMVITDVAGNTKNVTGQATTLDTTADAGANLAVVFNDGGGYLNNTEAGAASYTISGVDADATATVRFSDGNAAHDVVVNGLGNGTATVNLAGLTDGPVTASVSVSDTAGNLATGAGDSSVKRAADTTADAGPTLRLTGVTSTIANNKFSTISLKIAGFDSDLSSATITLKDNSNHTATHTLTSGELATAKSNGTDGTVTITSWTNVSALSKNDTITATIVVNDNAGNQATHIGSFKNQNIMTAPAGAAGEPIRLALSDPQDHAGLVTVHVANLPADWTLNEGSRNADSTWTVQTADPSQLTVTSAADFTGAVPLQVGMQWTHVDGSSASTLVTDNVEVYAPGSPIFALSADDNLTASSAADLLVFAQPIAQDTVYGFDAAVDKIDLIGFTGVGGVADLSIVDDAGGNAVIGLANGSTITVVGVHAASLTSDNFVFNVAPTTTNTGTLTISDGAMMPFGGVLDNSGTIALASADSDGRLEVLVDSLTLQGGGHLTLSDSDHNIIVGGASSAVLVNIDNTISGAGQLGAGQMRLDNHGTIVADGSHALVIDTGANTIANAGTLEATGSGWLVINSALDNSGTLWANGGNISVHGNVTGSGSAHISGSSALELDGAANVAVSFDQGGAGSLTLGDADHFSGSIAGFGGNNALHLTDITANGGTTIAYAAVASGSGGVLTLSDGSNVAHLTLQGSYGHAGFHASADQAGGMLVTANVVDVNQNLHGGAGTDILVTGAGDDILAGGAANDLLFGGGGADTFVFDSPLDGVGNIDTILDFKANGDADHLLLSQQVFGSLLASDGSLDAAQFAEVGDGSGGSVTLVGAVHVIYDSQTGNLYYDADGADTVGGRSVFAVLGGTDHHPATIDHLDIRLG